MTNPLRGEVPLQIGDTLLTLKLGVNALCAAEALLGRKAKLILDEIEAAEDGPSLEVLRGLTWAALRKHHGDMHLIEIGELIEEHGAPLFLDAVLRALQSAFGKATEDKEAPNPPKKRRTAKKAGTG